MRSIINVFTVSDNSGMLLKKYGKWMFALFFVKGLVWLFFAAGVSSLFF